MGVVRLLSFLIGFRFLELASSLYSFLVNTLVTLLGRLLTCGHS